MTRPAELTDEHAVTEGGYAAVRFNALRHGILSRHLVLPHEDAEEYGALLACLIDEHQPAGPTEAHLVEELAGTVWRKRRVLLAERAAMQRGLKRVAATTTDKPIAPAVPFETVLRGDRTDVGWLIEASPDALEQWRRIWEQAREATLTAARILEQGGHQCLGEALQHLHHDHRAWWEEEVSWETYTADPDGLAEFIKDSVLPACESAMKEVQHREAIRLQTLGEGVQPHMFENLSRYEVHLDRKFERTLGMLVKLKEMRSDGTVSQNRSVSY